MTFRSLTIYFYINVAGDFLGSNLVPSKSSVTVKNIVRSDGGLPLYKRVLTIDPIRYQRRSLPMSSGDYETSAPYRGKAPSEAATPKEAKKLADDRAERLAASRSKDVLAARAVAPRPRRDVRLDYSDDAVNLRIGRPDSKAKRLYVIAIDNSGSNRATATRCRESTEYLRVNLGLIDREAQYCFIYFSDHCDGDRMIQCVDWIYPDEAGQQILTSTLFHIDGVSGGDDPEAHECALWFAAQLDFGDVPVKDRHLVMVTDEVAHGMYALSDRRDDGCDDQRDWRRSLHLVDQTFGTFELIGSGNDADLAKAQQQFIAECHPDRLNHNFLSLASIRDQEHRLGIIPNALLFLIARSRGNQAIEAFLGRLYEKWLTEPIFGTDSDRRAREAIARFGKFIDLDVDQLAQFLGRVLAISIEEADALLTKVHSGEVSF